MSVHLAPIGNAFQFLDANGRVLPAGNIYTYQAGTTTPAATYTTSAGNVSNTNPIVLGSDGRPPQEIWLTDGSAYKFVLKDALGNTLGSYDNLTGIGDPTVLAQLAATSGSSLVEYLQAGSGAVARTVQARLRDIVNVKDFGATGDGGTDDTSAIQNAYTYAVSLGSCTVYWPAGSYRITSTITIGDAAGGVFKSINTVGAGAVSTSILWAGSTTGIALRYWRNKYAQMSGIAIRNSVAAGSTVGLLLSGPAPGTQSNNLRFSNVIFQGFARGVQAGDVAGEAASEIVFELCDFNLNTYGYYGSGTGNTLNIWCIGCSFIGNTQWGFWGGVSGQIHFFGGTSNGNGVGVINLFGNWAAVCTIRGMRHEITPPEVGYFLGSLNEVIVESCLFVSNTTVPTYGLIQGTHYQLSIKGCQFGQGSDVGWKTVDGDFGAGTDSSLYMESNRIFGTRPFEITNPGTATDGLRYQIVNNFYNAAMHGAETGVVIFATTGGVFAGAMTPDSVNGTATFAGAATVAVVFTAARENATYFVKMAGGANETFWVTAKTAQGFTLNSTNAASVASVDWSISR